MGVSERSCSLDLSHELSLGLSEGSSRSCREELPILGSKVQALLWVQGAKAGFPAGKPETRPEHFLEERGAWGRRSGRTLPAETRDPGYPGSSPLVM